VILFGYVNLAAINASLCLAPRRRFARGRGRKTFSGQSSATKEMARTLPSCMHIAPCETVRHVQHPSSLLLYVPVLLS
jgi:hypothetical protein